MKKENYVSDELQHIFLNNFILYCENKTNIENLWFGRSVMLYRLLIKIFKYKIENNIEINFKNRLEYLLDNYQLLKDKELLSLDEIKRFDFFIEGIPSVNFTNGKRTYSDSAKEQYIYVGTIIKEYLEESSFLIDFFYMKNNIENF